jgi:mono/diheme cytochrome c family protein
VKLDTHTNLPLLVGLIASGFIVLTTAVVLAPSVWVAQHNAPVAGSVPLTAEQQAGLRVYVSEGCPYCHTQQVRPLAEDTLYGRPSAPGDYARLAIVLNGLHGRAINGVSYTSIMPPWGALMTDAEIAAVVTHERTSWGNHASPETAADVATARHQPASP